LTPPTQHQSLFTVEARRRGNITMHTHQGTDSISAPILTKPLTRPYPHPVTATVPSFMLEPMALMLPLTYSDVLTKTGLDYTLSLDTVAPTIPAFPVTGPNNFLVSTSLFCSLHTYPPVSALLNPTTAALVPRPVGSSTLLLVVLILLSVLQVA
jgi:hypothetical protein